MTKIILTSLLGVIFACIAITDVQAGPTPDTGCNPDEHSKCADFKELGYCTGTYKAWMQRYCCQTCNPPCSDWSTSCANFADQGFCIVAWMPKKCCKSCTKLAEKKKPKKPKVAAGASKSSVNKDECLKSANKYRQLHANTPDLVWDDELARESQYYANKLKAASLRQRRVVMDHDPRNNAKEWGENIWYQNQPNNQVGVCEDSNKAWYSEIKDWDLALGRGKGGVTTHFTAMVWTATTKVGYGKVVFDSPGSYAGNTVTIIVAKYWTRANWVWQNEYIKYVMPLAGSGAVATGTGAAGAAGTAAKSGDANKSQTKVSHAVDADKCLANINEYRSRHVTTNDLVWDDELAREAQAWAEKLKVKSIAQGRVNIDHDDRNNANEWGENIWYQNQPNDAVGTCDDSNKSWYAEIKDWDLASGRKRGYGVTTHFTAMVWTTTTKVGYGKVVFPSPVSYYKDNTVTIVVAKFWTRANWVYDHEYINHVMPLKA